ncbi:Ni/Fe hydrogenase subunit alpha [Fundidesulfovibrio agrisoli]|uniref:Ni/Fe hydrogenase subunit alpha n=1 Tax=Fundidesulfovibrio agrisoli TaxID=2922717 RepID=UPI001FAC8DEA
MPRTIRIAPLTRIEGHAALDIHLDEAGDVADARMTVMSLRGFEKFLMGRPVEEVPRIVTRICGICPWQHHIASTKAAEACLGVAPTPTAAQLRELCQMLASIPDKILHFYFLAAPDFVLGPGADPALRNVAGLVGAAPELARKAALMRYRTQMGLEKFAGKVIHPVAVLVGGFSKPLLEHERAELLALTRDALDFSLESVRLARETLLPPLVKRFRELGEYPSAYLGMVDPNDGSLALHDGVLRLMDQDGSHEEFHPSDYTSHLAEKVEPWTYLKFPYMRRAGRLVLDEREPVGLYRTNCLARVNVCEGISTPLAHSELEIFRREFGRPAHQTFLYHWARLIELVYCCERAIELLEDPAILGRDIRTLPIAPRAGEGVGCVEAPRGTLIYHLKCDHEGMVTHANLLAGTTHNNAGMNLSARQAARSAIKGGVYDQGLLNTVEMSLRAYDP